MEGFDYGGPGPDDLLNAAAALAQALRGFAATEAQTAASLSAAGPLSDVRRARAVTQAASEAASRAALILEAANILAPGGTVPALAAALADAVRRAGLPPDTLPPLLRAAALSLPTDDASARIAASIRVAELCAALL